MLAPRLRRLQFLHRRSDLTIAILAEVPRETPSTPGRVAGRLAGLAEARSAKAGPHRRHDPQAEIHACHGSTRDRSDDGRSVNRAHEPAGPFLETIGTDPIQIVVEAAMYSNSGAVAWAAGANALATKLR